MKKALYTILTVLLISITALTVSAFERVVPILMYHSIDDSGELGFMSDDRLCLRADESFLNAVMVTDQALNAVGLDAVEVRHEQDVCDVLCLLCGEAVAFIEIFNEFSGCFFR